MFCGRCHYGLSISANSRLRKIAIVGCPPRVADVVSALKSNRSTLEEFDYHVVYETRGNELLLELRNADVSLSQRHRTTSQYVQKQPRIDS